MSSTVSTTEIQTISKKIILTPHKKMEEKRLVRTSSLEKIRRFNSFICSQQYYILPALLAWLKSSQSVLQSSTKKTIFFFRSLIFSHFLYKLYQVDFRCLIVNVLELFKKQILIHYRNIVESPSFLKLAVVVTASGLALQLGLCFYLLCLSCVPSGLVFLIVCLLYIIYLNVRSVYFKRPRGRSMTKKRN